MPSSSELPFLHERVVQGLNPSERINKVIRKKLLAIKLCRIIPMVLKISIKSFSFVWECKNSVNPNCSSTFRD